MAIVHPLEPVCDDKSRILILGSFPSVRSREVGFYYGHPQNRFWKVLERVVGAEEGSVSGDGTVSESSVEDLIDIRRKFLLDHHISVWDVIHSCTITGSADDTIRDVLVNDIGSILDRTQISVIYINGSKAYELYNKYARDDLKEKYGQIANAVLLPSTSPANAAWNVDKLCGAWSRIRIGLGKTTAGAYYSMNEYCRDTYGRKLYRLSLDGGFTCPNRDGSIGSRGCIFCDGAGSGAFSGSERGERVEISDILSQLEAQKARIANKMGRDDGQNSEAKYIAYFQAFTGTYDSIERLRTLYYEAISDSEVCVLSVATRPDCLSDEVLTLLAEINRIKPVWVELGLQTTKARTAKYIRRGYDLKVYNKAVNALQQIGISQIITHVILGLPGENSRDIRKTVRHVVARGTTGIKLQLLHVISGTDLEKDYQKGVFDTLTMDEYISLLEVCIDELPPDMVVHRLTGDGDKRTLIAPLWSADKKRVINAINKAFKSQ